MKKLLVAVMFFISMNTYGQVEVSLTNPQTVLTDAPFFVKDVLDQRADKNSIGTYQKEDSTIMLILKSGVRNSFIRFSDQAIASEENQKPLILTIRTLQLTANQNKDGVTSQLDMVVSEVVDSGSLELLTVSRQLDTSGVKLTTELWEQLLNNLFSEGLLSIRQYYDIPQNERPKPVFVKNAAVQPVLVSLYEEPSFKRVTMISPGVAAGNTGAGYGITVLHFRDFEDKNWSVAGRYSFEFWNFLVKIKQGYLEGDEVVVHGMLLKLGAQPMYHIGAGFYVCLPIQFPVGMVEEVYTDSWNGRYKMKTTIVAGLDLGQGICFIPRAKYGVYFGLRLYEQFLLSQTDVGLAIDLGIKF